MSHLRRLCALVAVATLAFTGLTIAGGPAQAATPDSRPLSIGASWLEGQLTSGLIHNTQYDFDDVGLTIDAGLSLRTIGGHGATVSAIANALAPKITGANGYIESDEFDFSTTPATFVQRGHYAGATAKALVFVQATGQNSSTWAGTDLVGALENRVTATGTSAGRISDDSSYGDNANVIGQAFAARGLSNATPVSSKATDVFSFLHKQQCSAGFFRLYFNPNPAASDQTCDGGTAGQSNPDTDATALAVLQLKAITSPTQDVTDAIDSAEAWLLGAQHADGSFGGGTATEAPNTDSTGLAGWALGELGDTAAAAKAATWVRAHQADVPTACANALSGQTGALGYDDAAVTAGRTDGITTEVQDQWRRATAPALPVLQWAPPATAPLDVSGPTDFVQAGTAVPFQVTGAAPGSTVCISGVGAPRALVAPSSGAFPVVVTMPDGTANRTVIASVRKGDSAGFAARVLGATTLTVTPARTKVHRGKRVRVVVTGLVPAEHVTIRLRGVVVRSGIADPDGRLVKRLRVGHKLGKARIVAQGEFPSIRHGRVVVRVVR